MSNIDDKLNEVLNIAADVLPATTPEENTELVIPQDKDPDSDFETGRENLYKLLDKGNAAIDGILALAKEGEHPRAYEVAGQLIKTVGETAEKLLDVQQKLKKLEVENESIKTQHNHLYVGNTAELQKFLKKNK